MVKTVCVDKLDELNSECADVLYITGNQEVIDYCLKEGLFVVAVETEGGPNLKCDYILQELDEVDDIVFDQIYQRYKGIPWDITDTERTHIREYCPKDLDALFELYSKEGVTKFMEPLYPYEEESVYEQNYIEYVYKLYGFGMWLVFDRESGELIGRAGIEVRETCEEAEQAELGFCITPERWGQGLAYEVCQEIVRLAREEYGLKTLIARSHPENFSSHNLLKKLGFTQVGIRDDGDFYFRKDL